jgi:hypothetical protein
MARLAQSALIGGLVYLRRTTNDNASESGGQERRFVGYDNTSLKLLLASQKVLKNGSIYIEQGLVYCCLVGSRPTVRMPSAVCKKGRM